MFIDSESEFADSSYATQCKRGRSESYRDDLAPRTSTNLQREAVATSTANVDARCRGSTSSRASKATNMYGETKTVIYCVAVAEKKRENAHAKVFGLRGVAHPSLFATISSSRRLRVHWVPMTNVNSVPDEVWSRAFSWAKMYQGGTASLLCLLSTCRRFAVSAGTSSGELR
jgi:hypothetical protein